MADAQIPDKPALEGLEAKWDAAWQGRGTYLFDRAGPPTRAQRRLLRRHSPAHRLGQPSHRPRVLVHAHRHQGAIRAHAGQDRVLPDGLGRQRPAHRAPRAELLRRALRPVAAVRPRLHSALRGRRQQELARRRSGADQPSQLHRALRDPHRPGRGHVRGAVPSARAERGLDPDVPHHLGRHDPHLASSHSCATSSAARRTRRWRRRCGTSTSAPRSRRPSSKTASSRPPTIASRSTSRTARATCSSRRPGPSCCRRASRSWRTPMTSAMQQLFGSTVRTPLFDVEVPVLAHPLAQQDKGSGIAMICTFGDVTDIVWWRELDLPNRTILGQDGRVLARRARGDRHRCRQGGVRRARGQDGLQREEARGRSCCRSPAS